MKSLTNSLSFSLICGILAKHVNKLNILLWNHYYSLGTFFVDFVDLDEPQILISTNYKFSIRLYADYGNITKFIEMYGFLHENWLPRKLMNSQYLTYWQEEMRVYDCVYSERSLDV